MCWSSGDNVTGDGDGVVGGSKWCGIGGWWGLLPPWYGRRLATLHPGTLLLQLCTHQPTDESSLMTYYDPSAPRIDTDHQWLALAWPERCYWPIIKGWLNVIKILQYTVYSTILCAKFWWLRQKYILGDLPCEMKRFKGYESIICEANWIKQGCLGTWVE